MESDIRNFNKQFAFRPEIMNIENLKVFENIIIGGMGGSHLSADLLKMLKPDLNLRVHSDYGLPPDVNRGKTLFIASSYSGNTEETLDFVEKVIEQKLPIAVIASGGKLLEIAKIYNLPCVVLPAGLQPRMALGYSFLALLAVLAEKELLDEAYGLERVLQPEAFEKKGKELAERLFDKIPLIYSARENFALAYIWKIKLNETGKVPAFCNSLPELDHNEIVGFDNLKSLPNLKNNFHAIFLRSGDEHPRILKRVELTKTLLEAKLPSVSIIDMVGGGSKPELEKAFNSIILADWTSFYIARLNGADPEKVGIVEELKRELA